MVFLFSMKHSIIVGLGLAGFNYAQQLRHNNKDFLIIDSPHNSASRNAAGICNPTVLKRYTMAWEGVKFMNYAIPKYRDFEINYKTNVFHSLPIQRYFFSPGEQNLWSIASQEAGLKDFLDPDFQIEPHQGIKKNFGFGTVNNVGRLAVNELLETFLYSLNDSQKCITIFDYTLLEINEDKVIYNGVEARNIVFCEGFGLKKNPWFNYLPLIGSKGEYLKIKAPELSQKQIIKGGLFISPLGENLFWVGATFNAHSKTNETSDAGLSWILSKLEKLVDIPFEVVYHGAQVRPTVIDRRPLLGRHPKHSNLYVFNGLGTRGVLMSPLLSYWLYEFINSEKVLPQAVAINRFETYFCNPNKNDV